jgi:hypothetical protein
VGHIPADGIVAAGDRLACVSNSKFSPEMEIHSLCGCSLASNVVDPDLLYVQNIERFIVSFWTSGCNQMQPVGWVERSDTHRVTMP